MADMPAEPWTISDDTEHWWEESVIKDADGNHLVAVLSPRFAKHDPEALAKMIAEAPKVKRERDRLLEAANRLLGEAYGRAVVENRPYSAGEAAMGAAIAECEEEA